MFPLLLVATMTVSQPDANEEIGWHAEGRGGAVAAGEADSVRAGRDILQAGGNAADSAAATILALAVTDYGRFAIGGEVSLLIYDQSRGQVRSLSGLGRAPLSPQAIAWFYEHGIPSDGSMKAAPVPGAMDLIVTLLEEFGTISFAKAANSALTILDRRQREWHAPLAKTLRRLVAAESEMQGSRAEKLQAVRHRFYRGDIAAELEDWYISVGSFLRREDLAAHRTVVEAPVCVDYRGYTVCKCGTWTQGPTLCQALRLLEGYDLRQMEHLSADYIHVVVESLKLAFADRDAYYADPEFSGVPIASLLSDKYTTLRRPLIDLQSASLEIRPGDPRRMRALRALQPASEVVDRNIPVQDTTTCVVVDRWGNMVAATPSCNLGGNEPGPLGITQGNRLRCLNTTAGHPNRLEAGKRPRITLTPTIVLKDGQPVIGISVAGGDLQDQTSLNVLLNHLEFGMPPRDAVTQPRFQTQQHENSFDSNPDRTSTIPSKEAIVVHAGVPEPVRDALIKRGHALSTTEGAIAHPVMVARNPATGQLQAAGDPQAGRHAAALPAEGP